MEFWNSLAIFYGILEFLASFLGGCGGIFKEFWNSIAIFLRNFGIPSNFFKEF